MLEMVITSSTLDAALDDWDHMSVEEEEEEENKNANKLETNTTKKTPPVESKSPSSTIKVSPKKRYQSSSRNKKTTDRKQSENWMTILIFLSHSFWFSIFSFHLNKTEISKL